MPPIRSSVVIARPIEEVFDFVAADADHEFGSRGSVPTGDTSHSGPEASVDSGSAEWTTLVRPGLLESRASGSGFKVHIRLDFERVPEGTRLTCRTWIRFSGLFGLLVALGMPLLRGKANQDLQLELQQLKRAIEASG